MLSRSSQNHTERNSLRSCGDPGLQLAIQLCRFSRRKRAPTVVQLGRLAELRAEYDEIAARTPLPRCVSYLPVNAGGVDAEWLSAPQADTNRAILYLHGGCYVTGS